MSEEKRMLGNYEVVNSIYIGDKEVVFGVDKSDKYPFLVEVDTDKCLVMLNGEEVRLTSTEYKLLCYLIENKGRIVTKAMLLEQLWDIDGNFVDENTVRVNIKRLRQKLNDDKQEYIVTVFGMGYTFGE